MLGLQRDTRFFELIHRGLQRDTRFQALIHRVISAVIGEIEESEGTHTFRTFSAVRRGSPKESEGTHAFGDCKGRQELPAIHHLVGAQVVYGAKRIDKPLHGHAVESRQ